jgi:hypothetical protein
MFKAPISLILHMNLQQYFSQLYRNKKWAPKKTCAFLDDAHFSMQLKKYIFIPIKIIKTSNSTKWKIERH